jgi:hypothetical protein
MVSVATEQLGSSDNSSDLSSVYAQFESQQG